MPAERRRPERDTRFMTRDPFWLIAESCLPSGVVCGGWLSPAASTAPDRRPVPGMTLIGWPAVFVAVLVGGTAPGPPFPTQAGFPFGVVPAASRFFPSWFVLR